MQRCHLARHMFFDGRSQEAHQKGLHGLLKSLNRGLVRASQSVVETLCAADNGTLVLRTEPAPAKRTASPVSSGWWRSTTSLLLQFGPNTEHPRLSQPESPGLHSLWSPNLWKQVAHAWGELSRLVPYPCFASVEPNPSSRKQLLSQQVADWSCALWLGDRVSVNKKTKRYSPVNMLLRTENCALPDWRHELVSLFSSPLVHHLPAATVVHGGDRTKRIVNSYAPIPPIERTAAHGFESVIARIACPTPLARVEREHRNGAHAFSTSAPNWRASVFESNLQKAVPVAISLTPPSRFECRHCGEQETPGYLHISCCQGQELSDFQIIEAHFQHLVRTTTRSKGAASWRTTEAIVERADLHLQWGVELQHLSGNGSDLLLRPPVLQFPESLVVLGRERCACQGNGFSTGLPGI